MNIITEDLTEKPQATKDGPGREGNRLGSHIPALDGLRGYAAALVVISHLDRVGYIDESPQFTGPAGVLIFFVLSGFLMGHLYLWKPVDRAAIAKFIIARVARVLPIFYIVVTASFVISTIIGKHFIYYLDTKNYIKHIFFVGSKHVFWSIPPEFEFYFVFTGIWFIVATGSAKRFAPILALAIALIFIARPFFPGITVFSHLHIFLTGIAVALLREKLGAQSFNLRAVTAAQVFCVTAVIIIATSLVSFRDKLPPAWQADSAVYGHFPTVMMAGAALFAFSIRTKFSSIIFSNPFAVRLGAYSFSLYLLHEPVMDLTRQLGENVGLPWAARLFISLSSALIIAALSYRYLEMPLQHLIRGVAKNKRLNRFIAGN